MKKQIEYESEMTRFIRELHQQKPHLADDQRKARSRWWDRTPAAVLDPAEERRIAESRLRQQAYVYQTRG